MESLWLEKTSKIPNSNHLSVTAPMPWNYSSFHFGSKPAETILEFPTVSCESLMFSRLEAGWSPIRQPSRAPFAPLHPSGSLRAVFHGNGSPESMNTERLLGSWPGSSSSAGEEFGLEQREGRCWSLPEARHFYYGRKWGQAQPLWMGIVCWKGSPGDFLFFLGAFVGWECPWKMLPSFEYGNMTMLHETVELPQNTSQGPFLQHGLGLFSLKYVILGKITVFQLFRCVCAE